MKKFVILFLVILIFILCLVSSDRNDYYSKHFINKNFVKIDSFYGVFQSKDRLEIYYYNDDETEYFEKHYNKVGDKTNEIASYLRAIRLRYKDKLEERNVDIDLDAVDENDLFYLRDSVGKSKSDGSIYKQYEDFVFKYYDVENGVFYNVVIDG